jgi:hypothetical protein
METKEVRKKGWGPHDLIDWLRNSHVHIITTHIHQGLAWPILDVLAALDSLKDHPGYPSGEQLDCPVFRQDKHKYLSVLPIDRIIPTMCKFAA